MSMKLADLKKSVKEIQGFIKSVRERKQNGLTTDADIKFVAENEKKEDAAKIKLTKALDALKAPVPIKIGTDETDDLDDFFQEILEEGDFNKTNQAFVKSFVKKVPLDYPTLSEDRYLLSTIATDGNVAFIDLLLSIPNIKFGLVDFLSTCMYSHLHRIPTMTCVMKHEKTMKFEDELEEVKPMFKEFIHAISKSKFDAKNENRTGRLELIEKLLKTPLFELDADEDEGDDCQTILSRACLEGDTLLIAYLSKAGFIRNVNRIQSDKRTPLMNAVIGNSAEALLFLLSNGADVAIKGDDGTALELAESLPGRDATILMALKNPEKFKKEAPAKTAGKKEVTKGKEPPSKPDDAKPEVEDSKGDDSKKVDEPKKPESKPPGKADSKKTPAPPSKPPAQPVARRPSATADSLAPSTTAAKDLKDASSTVSTQPKVVSPSTPRDPKPPSTSPSKAPRPPAKGASPLASGGKSMSSAVGALLETIKDVRQAIRTMDEMMVYNDEEEAKKKGLQAKVEETKDQLVKELTDNYKKKRVKCDITSDSEKESLVNLVDMLLGELDTSEINRNLFRLLFENVKVDWPDLCEENSWLVNATSDGSLEFMQVMLSYPHIRVDTVDLVTTAVYNMLYRIPCTALLLRHEEVLKLADHLDELVPLFQEFVADIASSKKENAKEVRTGRLDLIEKLFSHKLLNLDPSAETDQGQTVFSRAAFEGDYELMSRLLRIRKAPDINRVQSDQTTALIQAVFSNSPPTVALILAQSGVNINHVSPQGTALSIGITLQRDLGIVQKLKSMGGKREEELPPEQRKVGLPSIESSTKKAAADEEEALSAAEDISLPAINKKGPVMMPSMDRKAKDGDKPVANDKKKEVKKIQGPTVVKKKF